MNLRRSIIAALGGDAQAMADFEAKAEFIKDESALTAPSYTPTADNITRCPWPLDEPATDPAQIARLAAQVDDWCRGQGRDMRHTASPDYHRA